MSPAVGDFRPTVGQAEPIGSVGLLLLVIGALTSVFAWRHVEQLYRVARVGRPVEGTVIAIKLATTRLNNSSTIRA